MSARQIFLTLGTFTLLLGVLASLEVHRDIGIPVTLAVSGAGWMLAAVAMAITERRDRQPQPSTEALQFRDDDHEE
ncbi:hypothetical protein [Microbispora sp. NPDC049633]|uniref:hypothetical protein n=1 Tax=Microbispora sp. NPDC049633 TaxID=3154355 RepID=UPI00343CB63A